jgi:hypothetical protein
VVGRSTIVSGAVSGIVAVSTLLAYRIWWHPSEPSGADTWAAERSSLERQLALSQRESAALRHRVATQGSRGEIGSADTEGSVGDAAPAGTLATVPETSKSGDDEYPIYVEAKFESESVDRDWRPERDLSGNVTGILPVGSAIRKLDCRSSMCRLETSHKDTASYMAFTQSVVAMDGGSSVWMGPVLFNVIQESGRPENDVIAVAYLGRESLPSPEK